MTSSVNSVKVAASLWSSSDGVAAWFDFEEAMGLQLPAVTRMMIKDAGERMKDPTRPKLFMRYKDKGMKPTAL